MADKKAVLTISLGAVDNTVAKLNAFNKRLDAISKKVGKIGKTMTTSFTLPIVAGFGLATRSMMEFQKGMASVSTLIDTNTENLDAMSAAVLAIGRRTPVALEDLTGALFEARSAGVSASDQFHVLEQSARLAVAGLGTTNEAVDLVTSSLNAFKPTGQDAVKLYDTIFKATAFGKMTIAGLSRGFGSVAGTVAASNIKLDEYLASVAALTTTGLPASEAHTQLRAVIAGLTRTTDKSRIVFRKLGAKDFKDLIAKSGGLVPAITRVNKLLKGNSSMLLELVGSTEALNAIIGLTGGQADVFTRALHDMREGTNAVDGAFDKQNKTMAARLTRTKNAMSVLGIQVGTILTPALEKLSGWLQRITDWFTKLNPSTQEWIVRIAAAVAVVGPALIVLGKMAAAVRVLGAAFTVMSGASIAGVTALGGALAIVALKLAAITVGIIAAQKAWEFLQASTGERTGSASELLKEGKLHGTDAVMRPSGEEGFSRVVSLPPGASAEDARRATADALGAIAPGAPLPAALKVEFVNAPRGMRVTPGPGAANVDTKVGYNLLGYLE